MIETVLLERLSEALPVPVAMERPTPEPEAYVLLDRLDGHYREHLPRSGFALQSYAPSLYEAAKLSQSVKEALMTSVLTDDRIAKVSIDNEHNFTDPKAKRYRYQLVVTLHHY